MAAVQPAQRVVPATVWCRADQCAWVSRIAAGAGLHIERAGGPQRPDATSIALGEVEVFDDLRAAIATAHEGVVLIADGAALEAGGAAQWPQHAETLRAAAGRGVRIVCLAPIPASLADLVTLAPDGGALPLATVAPGAAPGDPAQGDAPDVLSVECLGAPLHGSLGLRVLEAMDAIGSVMGEAESVSAAYCGPAGASSPLHAVPGDTLRALHGSLSATLRFGGGRSAVVLASDRADALRTRVVALRAGAVRSCTAPEPLGDDAAAAHVADHVARALRQRPNAEQAGAMARALAMAQAALLSCRTGESERPEMMRRMAGL